MQKSILLGFICFFQALFVSTAVNAQVRPLRQRTQLKTPSVPPAQSEARARELMQLYLREGQRKAFVGEQITQLFGARPQESRQIWKQLGPGRMRVEYLSPSSVKGDIIVVNGPRLMRYSAADNRIYIGPALTDEGDQRFIAVNKAMKQAGIRMRVVGTEVVAGRQSSIIEVSFPQQGTKKRFWFDQKTNVRLRIEDIGKDGIPLSNTLFETIDYNSSPSPLEFLPRSLPRAALAPMVPRSRPHTSLSAASNAAGFEVREPEAPSGYRVEGYWVVSGRGGRTLVAIQFVHPSEPTFVLWQGDEPPRPEIIRMAARNSDSVLKIDQWFSQWTAGDRTFTLIGSVRRAVVESISNSLQSR